LTEATPTPAPLFKRVEILADLLEKGDTVVRDETPGVIASIKRVRARLRVSVTVELADGRTFTVGGSKMVLTLP